MAEPASVACVVVTYNALPWVESSLASVAGVPTVVVDNGSSDGTPAFVRERFPAVTLVEQPNLGLCAGWNRGIAATESDLVLILNADAWVHEGALAELVAAAARHSDAGVVVPRLENRDGTLQRSVRGFPSAWRIATEYLYLRKLAPRSAALNGFYAAGFDHDDERRVDWAMGACMMIRRDAFAEVGPFDERFFLFSEEVDWIRRAADRRWSCWFVPTARVTHVGGAAHGGRLWQENVKGHLRYLALHEGRREAERARRAMRIGTALRGRIWRGDAAAQARAVSRWLGSGTVDELLGH